MALKNWKKSTEKDIIALWEHKDGKKDVFVNMRGNPQQGYLYDVILEDRRNGVKHIEIGSTTRNRNVAIRKAYNYVKRY